MAKKKKKKAHSANGKHKPAKRRPSAKRRLKAIAETPPDQGETGNNYPGEVMIAPEGIPLKVSVPGAPSPMAPTEADAPVSRKGKPRAA